MMRSRTQTAVNLKLVFICCSFAVLILVLVTRPGFSSSSDAISKERDRQEDEEQQLTKSLKKPNPECPSLPLNPTCTKLPTSISDALIHYATTNITPQQTFDEISVSKRVLDKMSPCNFLVFGLGYDSPMWVSLNHGGRTLFLEEDKSWIETVKQKFPTLESYHVVYDTKVKESEKLMNTAQGEDCKSVTDPRESKCGLALKGLPAEVYETEWDLIMVDAPTGYHEEAPGRMSAIYTAGLMARNREQGETHIFVHDVDRVVEDRFSLTFLCDGYMTEQQGRIRHFIVPSHRTSAGRPYCPVNSGGRRLLA